MSGDLKLARWNSASSCWGWPSSGSAGKLAGEGMERLGQSAVLGELLAGMLIGPAVLGPVHESDGRGRCTRSSGWYCQRCPYQARCCVWG